MPGRRQDPDPPHAHLRERVELSLSRPGWVARDPHRQPDHDHRAADPEPFRVIGHDSARDVAQALPGENRANEEDDDGDHDQGSSHSLTEPFKSTQLSGTPQSTLRGTEVRIPPHEPYRSPTAWFRQREAHHGLS